VRRHATTEFGWPARTTTRAPPSRYTRSSTSPPGVPESPPAEVPSAYIRAVDIRKRHIGERSSGTTSPPPGACAMRFVVVRAYPSRAQTRVAGARIVSTTSLDRSCVHLLAVPLRRWLTFAISSWTLSKNASSELRRFRRIMRAQGRRPSSGNGGLHARGSPLGDVHGAYKVTDLSAQEKALEFSLLRPLRVRDGRLQAAPHSRRAAEVGTWAPRSRETASTVHRDWVEDAAAQFCDAECSSRSDRGGAP
jgi:hypothetical protein